MTEAAGLSGETGAGLPERRQPAKAENILEQDQGASGKQDGPDGLSAEEETRLAELIDKRDRARAGADAVRLKVEPPHSELHHAGVVLTREYTSVPARLAALLQNAAASAGVELTEESES